ncbi:hypothetical protein ACTFIZ_000183 [Dictyostelium cf. discoideum]
MFSNFFGSSKRNTIAISSKKEKDNGKDESSKLKNSGSSTLPKPITNNQMTTTTTTTTNNESGNNFITSPSVSSPLTSPLSSSPLLSSSSNSIQTSFSQQQQQQQQQPHQGVITSLQMKPSCTSLTDDIEKKKQAKYDSSLEQTARKWVCDVLEIQLEDDKSFYELFKNGVLLCKLINKLRDGTIKRINESTISFKQLENIENYLKACKTLGLQSVNLFNSIDLHENKDISLVITNIVVLGKHASKIEGYNGVHLAGERKIIKITTTPVSPLFGGSSNYNNNNNNNNNTSNGDLSPTSITSASGGSSNYNNPLNKSSNGKKAKWRKSVKIPAVSSLNSDIRTKEAFKFSPELQKAAQDWIEEITKEKFKSSFSSSLKDGILLCRLINTIIPNTILYINNGNSSFKKMENIGNYLKGCLVVGLKKTDLFDTPDLFEEKNINFVISNIHVLGNHVNKMYSHLKLPLIKNIGNSVNGGSGGGGSGGGGGNGGDGSPLKMYSSIIHSKFGNSSNNNSGGAIIAPPEDMKDLKDWINHHLRAHHSLQIGSDMSNDLRNGVTLLTLLEELTLQKVGIFAREPVLPWHFMQNICLLLNFLRENSVHNVSDISPHDLFNGDIHSLCMITRLIRENFDSDHQMKSIPMDTRRQKVIEEIIATEQSYVKSLSTVYNLLIVPLLNSLDTISPILSNDEISSIFGNWEHLLRSHINLLKEFKLKLNLPFNDLTIDDSNQNQNHNNIFGDSIFDSNITIGDVFLEKCEFLKDNYTNYINNYDNSYQRVKRLKKSNSNFEELVNTFEIFQDTHNGLDLYSYLIMPIQRIVRYILLLKEVIKYTPSTHPDYQMLQNAKENIKRVADHVNESKMAVENKRKISSIQDSIQNLQFNLMEKERTYIREGFLEIEDTFKKDSYFFLFSDLLLFVKYKPSEETGKEFKYKEVFYLDQVVDVSDILSDDEGEACVDDNDEYEGGNGDATSGSADPEDQTLRRSCNSSNNNNNNNNNNSSSNKSNTVYSFEIETCEFSLVLLAESHTEKIEWMEDLRSCLQHQLIKEEDQLSSLSLSDNDDDNDADVQSSLNSINSPLLLLNNNNINNNNNCKNSNININSSIDNNNNNNNSDNNNSNDYDSSENKINSEENVDSSDEENKTSNRRSVSFKTHKRLESDETISDTESDDYELACGRFKKSQPPPVAPRKITFSENIKNIDNQ